MNFDTKNFEFMKDERELKWFKMRKAGVCNGEFRPDTSLL